MTPSDKATAENFEKIIRVEPAFDRRHADPSKDYGIGSVRLLFVLKGTKGAISFGCSTGMYLPQQVSEHGHKPWREWQPMGYSVGCCSPYPRYEGQQAGSPCEWLDGKPCYGDGSCLAAEEVMKTLIRKGEEGVWQELENYYDSWLS